MGDEDVRVGRHRVPPLEALGPAGKVERPSTELWLPGSAWSGAVSRNQLGEVATPSDTCRTYKVHLSEGTLMRLDLTHSPLRTKHFKKNQSIPSERLLLKKFSWQSEQL